MSSDPTENIRRNLVAQINSDPQEREALQAKYGKVWNTQELQEEFIVEGFMAPFVVARRKSDGKKGSLAFQHYPRYYFTWQEDK